MMEVETITGETYKQKTATVVIDDQGTVTIPEHARRALGIEGEETVAELIIRINEQNNE